MVYNLTTMYLQNDSVGMLTELNTLSDGWFIGWMLIALYLALLFYFQNNSLRKSSIVAAAMTALVSIYLLTMGLIGMNITLLIMVILFISIIMVLLMGE